MPSVSPVSWSCRSFITRIFLVSCLPALCCMAMPVANRISRSVILFSLLLGILTGLLHLPRTAWLRVSLLSILLLIGIWVLSGSTTIDRRALRQAYVTRLRSFDSTKYVWGGEAHWGIDCSGLGRISLWEAMVREGVVQHNPRLLFLISGRFWWHDMAARDMLHGTYGYTKPLGHALKLAGYHNPMLLPGDLAVSAGGVHVLIYLGEMRWIQASPNDGKVLVLRANADSQHVWFNMPVTLVRWRILG